VENSPAKPCGILDVAGFFAPLRALLDTAVAAGFVRPAHREMVLVDADPAALLDRLAAWTPVTVSKWLDPADRGLRRAMARTAILCPHVVSAPATRGRRCMC
jgi:hypothetical protein